MLAISAFNYRIDPFCATCREIDATRLTLNPYYRMAQNVAAQPLTQQIVLGTSRGEAFPVDWLEAHTKLKTLNLSVGGAEVFTKLALLRIARQRAPLTSVIWSTDYFEFVEGLRNQRFLVSPALRKYVVSDLNEPFFLNLFARPASFFDHNTLEAALVMLKRKGPFEPFSGGPTPEQCRRRPAEPMSTELRQQIQSAYVTYAENILRRPWNTEGWLAFRRELNRLKFSDVRVTILIPPYHPDFRERLRTKQPEIYEKHQRWIADLQRLQHPKLRVVSFFDGLPIDTPGSENWRDGDHFSCQAATDMLAKARF